MMQPINPEGAIIPGISQAMKVNADSLLFLSGHVPFKSDGNLAGPDLSDQLHQTFLNVEATLAAAGASFKNMARLTIYIKDYDLSELETIRSVRDKFIDADKAPASALIGVADLFHPDVRVEIDGIAELD